MAGGTVLVHELGCVIGCSHGCKRSSCEKNGLRELHIEKDCSVCVWKDCVLCSRVESPCSFFVVLTFLVITFLVITFLVITFLVITFLVITFLIISFVIVTFVVVFTFVVVRPESDNESVYIRWERNNKGESPFRSRRM
jgi:hypothetical protein